MCQNVKALVRIVFLLGLLPFYDALSTAQIVPNFDGPAELPRVYVKTSLSDSPAPGKVWQVREGGSVLQALNRAACGDTVELQAGATEIRDRPVPDG